MMGMSSNDKVLHNLFEDFKSTRVLTDPFRCQYPRKKLYSFVSEQGKSRGDRVYVNDDLVNTISDIKYVKTPFNMAHKVMIFSIHNKIDIGPGYYKMNSSVVKDPLYRNEIEKIYHEMNTLHLDNPIDWWDLFAMVVRTTTITYCREKSRIRKALKRSVQAQMTRLEAVDNDNMTMEQKQDLAYLKAKYDEIIDQEIKGHQIRTKGQPTFEINEPNIEYYFKLEQRSRQKGVITHLQDENGKIINHE